MGTGSSLLDEFNDPNNPGWVCSSVCESADGATLLCFFLTPFGLLGQVEMQEEMQKDSQCPMGKA